MKPVQQFLKDWEVIFPKTDGEYSGYWLTNPNGQKVNIEFYLERFFEEYGDKSFIGRRKLSDLSILNLTEEEIEEVLLKFKEGVYLNIPNFIGSLMTEEEYKQIIADMKSCEIGTADNKHFNIEDMKKCFEESRLTHPMVGFKHDTFKDFINTLQH